MLIGFILVHLNRCSLSISHWHLSHISISFDEQKFALIWFIFVLSANNYLCVSSLMFSLGLKYGCRTKFVEFICLPFCFCFCIAIRYVKGSFSTGSLRICFSWFFGISLSLIKFNVFFRSLRNVIAVCLHLNLSSHLMKEIFCESWLYVHMVHRNWIEYSSY